MAADPPWIESVYHIKLRELREIERSEVEALLGEMRSPGQRGADMALLRKSGGRLADDAVARCEAAIPALADAHVRAGERDVSAIVETIQTKFVDPVLAVLPGASLYVSGRDRRRSATEGLRLRQIEEARFSARKTALARSVLHYVVRAVGDTSPAPAAPSINEDLRTLAADATTAHVPQVHTEVSTGAERTSLGPFDVALSFPGSERARVVPIALSLNEQLGEKRVFYDKFFKAQLARPNLDVVLQDVYRHRSRLLVVFIGQGYQDRDWCGVEWRAIRDIMKSRQDERVMLVRTDDALVDGILSIDGYVDLRETSSSELVALILERLENLKD